MWKKIITIIVLIILIVLISVFSQRDAENNPPEINNQEEESAFTEPLIVKYQYKDGVHVFVGDLELPNPCYTYNAEIVDSEDPNVKNLIVNYQPTGDEMCIEVIANATYRAAYPGPENLEFKAFVNGEERRLNPFEVPLDVDINDFQIFNKG